MSESPAIDVLRRLRDQASRSVSSGRATAHLLGARSGSGRSPRPRRRGSDCSRWSYTRNNARPDAATLRITIRRLCAQLVRMNHQNGPWPTDRVNIPCHDSLLIATSSTPK